MLENPSEGLSLTDPQSRDAAMIGRIGAIPTILDLACRLTGMGFAAVARVTEDRWIACAVNDKIGFGLKPGDELEVRTTICDEIRDHGEAVVIDHVAEDDAFCDHPTPRIYGFQSYISVPIVRTNGQFFGTLCAIDPAPAKLSATPIQQTFEMFAKLIASQLESEEQVRESATRAFDASAAADLREQFIAVLGHDLRNPLAAVEGGMRLIERTPINDKAASILRMMRTSTARMARLIDDVLDLARGRLGGGIPVETARVNLHDVIQGVVTEIRTAYPDRQIEARITLDGPVNCDPGRIAQLLSNLMANAVSHGDRKAPVVVTAAHEDGKFTLEVANRGDPIPPDKQARLFQPFTRGDQTDPNKGLGLGLYISGEIARAHGGFIKLDSAGNETRFKLVIPNA